MTLSDKKLTAFREEISGHFYWDKDVKAFIKELKEKLNKNINYGTLTGYQIIEEQIDKLAGPELNKMTLSDKQKKVEDLYDASDLANTSSEDNNWYWEEDLKAFIKALKVDLEKELDESDRYNEGVVCHDFDKCWNKVIDKLAGEQLTK